MSIVSNGRVEVQGAPGGVMRASSHIPELDGWRAVAITLVLFAHMGPSAVSAAERSLGWRVPVLPEGLGLGLLGVKIFFALSGYLITTRLLDEWARTGGLSLASFYWRRFFRIIPPVAVFLSLVAILGWLGIVNVGYDRLLATLLFNANYTSAPGSWYVGHFWSLAVEEHFYFIWPSVMVLMIGRRSFVWWVLALAVLLAVWRATAFKFEIGAVGERFWARTDIQADGILWGALWAIVLGLGDRRFLDRLIAIPGFIYISVAVVLSLELLRGVGWKSAMFSYALQPVIISLMIISTVQRVDRSCSVCALLNNSLVQWVGRLSYSIYIWQQLFLTPENVLMERGGLFQSFPGNLFWVIVFASASYYFVELPSIRYGRQVASRWRNAVH